jgi:hypothetical protein
MATKTILVDDLDGTEAFRTIRFAFDGRLFEIDLSREHYDSFKHGLTPWMEAGREVSKFSSSKSASGATYSPRPPARSRDESVAIREWARSKGMVVPSGGMIKREIVQAYEAAHAHPQPATPEAPKPHPPENHQQHG